jgi:hypothetical protein
MIVNMNVKRVTRVFLPLLVLAVSMVAFALCDNMSETLSATVIRE